MQSPDGNHLWCLSQSLWSLIAEHVSSSELPKIHTVLGNSLVDMYIGIHSEVRCLLKLLVLPFPLLRFTDDAGFTFSVLVIQKVQTHCLFLVGPT